MKCFHTMHNNRLAHGIITCLMFVVCFGVMGKRAQQHQMKICYCFYFICSLSVWCESTNNVGSGSSHLRMFCLFNIFIFNVSRALNRTLHWTIFENHAAIIYIVIVRRWATNQIRNISKSSTERKITERKSVPF